MIIFVFLNPDQKVWTFWIIKICWLFVYVWTPIKKFELLNNQKSNYFCIFEPLSQSLNFLIKLLSFEATIVVLGGGLRPPPFLMRLYYICVQFPCYSRHLGRWPAATSIFNEIIFYLCSISMLLLSFGEVACGHLHF